MDAGFELNIATPLLRSVQPAIVIDKEHATVFTHEYARPVVGLGAEGVHAALDNLEVTEVLSCKVFSWRPRHGVLEFLH